MPRFRASKHLFFAQPFPFSVVIMKVIGEGEKADKSLQLSACKWRQAGMGGGGGHLLKGF